MSKYKLELDEKQARVVQDALECYGRVLMGQLEYVEEVWRWRTPYSEEKMKKMEEMRRYLEMAKGAIKLSPNSHFGVNNPEISDDARKAFDIQQVMRYVSSWHRAGKDPKKDERNHSEMMGVNYDEPYKYSKDDEFELPTMEVV